MSRHKNTVKALAAVRKSKHCGSITAAMGLHNAMPRRSIFALPSRYKRGMHREGLWGQPFFWMMFRKVVCTVCLLVRGWGL